MHPARVKRATSRYRLDQGFGQAFTLNKKSPQYKDLGICVPFQNPSGGIVDLINGLAFTKNGNPEWVNDAERGWAMDFDGTDDYYKNDPTDFTGPLTIAVWVKANATAQDALKSIFSSKDGGANSSFQIDVDGADPGVYRVNATSGGGSSLQFTYGTVTLEWVHLVMVTNGLLGSSGGNIWMYYNGVEVINSGNFGLAEIQAYKIGTNRASSSNINARIADFRGYFNRIISANEVYEMYKNPWDLFKVREPRVWVAVTAVGTPAISELDDLAIGESIGADLTIGVGIDMDGAGYQGTGVRVR